MSEPTIIPNPNGDPTDNPNLNTNGWLDGIYQLLASAGPGNNGGTFSVGLNGDGDTGVPSVSLGAAKGSQVYQASNSFSLLSSASINATSLCSNANGGWSGGMMLGSLAITNLSASTKWLWLYDTTTLPTSGSVGTPIMKIAIPTLQTINPIPVIGLGFIYGIVFALSTSGSTLTSVAAGDLMINATTSNFGS